jgi:hypothetical protein
LPDAKVRAYSESNVLAHIVSHLLYVGPLTDGLEVHQRWLNRACCNPAHLEAPTTSGCSQSDATDGLVGWASVPE